MSMAVSRGHRTSAVVWRARAQGTSCRRWWCPVGLQHSVGKLGGCKTSDYRTLSIGGLLFHPASTALGASGRGSLELFGKSDSRIWLARRQQLQFLDACLYRAKVHVRVGRIWPYQFKHTCRMCSTITSRHRDPTPASATGAAAVYLLRRTRSRLRSLRGVA